MSLPPRASGTPFPHQARRPELSGEQMWITRWTPWRVAPAALVFVFLGCQQRVGAIRVDGSVSLQPPLTLAELLVWRDGGSLGFVLRDAAGTELRFCVAGPIPASVAGRWFIGATHPSHEGARIIDAGGGVENALRRALQVWVSQHYNQAEQDELLRSGWTPEIAQDKTRREAWHVLRLLRREPGGGPRVSVGQ